MSSRHFKENGISDVKLVPNITVKLSILVGGTQLDNPELLKWLLS